MESEDDETEIERQQARLEFKRKEISRKLKKDELAVLKIINEGGELLLKKLKEISKLPSDKLDEILDALEMKSKIKVTRELTTASWTKHIYSIEVVEDKAPKKEKQVNTKIDDFIWNLVWRVPCFLCPFMDRCDITQVKFNPNICTWFTDWIWGSLENKEYFTPFNDIDEKVFEV